MDKISSSPKSRKLVMAAVAAVSLAVGAVGTHCSGKVRLVLDDNADPVVATATTTTSNNPSPITSSAPSVNPMQTSSTISPSPSSSSTAKPVGVKKTPVQPHPSKQPATTKPNYVSCADNVGDCPVDQPPRFADDAR